MRTNELKFYGDGAKLFGIQIINAILTIVTLGIYYPWAKAANLKYIYQETEFAGSRFVFHGTGKEMFKGFVKLVLIIIVFYAALFGLAYLGTTATIIGVLAFYLGILFLIPVAIHGALKYRLSRTSWRGIHFGYRGDLKELIKICFVGYFFTLITFGFYVSWLEVKIRKYVMTNSRMGDVSFDFRGEGGNLLGTKIFGGILIVLTLGIYTPWYLAELQNFYINNTRIMQGDRQFTIRGNFKGSTMFKQLIVSLLIIVFTLGLGYSWVIVRYLRFVMENIEIPEAFDADTLTQTETAYTNATGDDMADILDIGLV